MLLMEILLVTVRNISYLPLSLPLQSFWRVVISCSLAYVIHVFTVSISDPMLSLIYLQHATCIFRSCMQGRFLIFPAENSLSPGASKVSLHLHCASPRIERAWKLRPLIPRIKLLFAYLSHAAILEQEFVKFKQNAMFCNHVTDIYFLAAYEYYLGKFCSTKAWMAWGPMIICKTRLLYESNMCLYSC